MACWVRMVQARLLLDNLSALENIILGLPPKRPPLLDLDSARAQFEKLAKEYQLDIDPSTRVWQLPVGKRQWLEILKQLFRDVKILILDEPTSVLTPSEAEQLFRTMRRLVNEGQLQIGLLCCGTAVLWAPLRRMRQRHLNWHV